jgi:hypothetical protein
VGTSPDREHPGVADRNMTPSRTRRLRGPERRHDHAGRSGRLSAPSAPSRPATPLHRGYRRHRSADDHRVCADAR